MKTFKASFCRDPYPHEDQQKSKLELGTFGANSLAEAKKEAEYIAKGHGWRLITVEAGHKTGKNGQ